MEKIIIVDGANREKTLEEVYLALEEVGFHRKTQTPK